MRFMVRLASLSPFSFFSTTFTRHKSHFSIHVSRYQGFGKGRDIGDFMFIMIPNQQCNAYRAQGLFFFTSHSAGIASFAVE